MPVTRRKKMDKSWSDQCQDVEDGSWDLEEEEEEEIEKSGANSWDNSSDSDGKRETKIERFAGIDSGTSASSGPKIRRTEDCLIVEDLEEPGENSGESVWKIPCTQRSESTAEVAAIIRRMVNKKSKSEVNIAKNIFPGRRSRSFGDLTGEANFSIKDAVVHFEGEKILEKPKIDLGEIVRLGDIGTHFQEIECRTLITKKDKSESEDDLEHYSRGKSGFPGKEEASSLPDIAGTSRGERLAKSEFRKSTSFTTDRYQIREKMDNSLTESWILLDEMGQSQPVTLTEVTFLLNGKSADAVLQENKEHFIPKSTVVRNANSDLRIDEWNPLVEESLQHYLNEDSGGEESTPKSIRLERKFGNMLLYIQSGVNLTSSVRFIPVDTEMIHMWRQSRDRMSPISSEDDARASVSENITEETSEWDNPDTSDDIRCDIHKPSPSVKKRKGRQAKMEDCENRTNENRRIIDSLTDEIKQLRMRLETERCRTSGLEQENHHLRGQLDKYKSGCSSSDSRKSKSEISENCHKKRKDKTRVVDVSSSSLLSIDEFKDEQLNRKEPKNFNESLDVKLNAIEEILKCKNPNGAADNNEDVSTTVENFNLNTSVSTNTFGIVETPSIVMSVTTGSTESWFRPKKTDFEQRNVSELINDLEKENERLIAENVELKKKLNEISLELDDYVSSCAGQSPTEEGRQAESLRNQVCNLKLELENMKSLAKNKEQRYKLKETIVREQLAEKSISLEEWKTTVAAIFQEMDDCRTRLTEMRLYNPNALQDPIKQSPRNLITSFRSLTAVFMEKIEHFLKENNILEKSLQESAIANDKSLVFGKEKGDHYSTLLSEKNSLEEEIANLRKENDLLLACQLDHYERLRNALVSLKEEKTKFGELESFVKLMEVEKGEISEALVCCKQEKSIAESELRIEAMKVNELEVECERRKSEAKKLEIKLEEAVSKCKTFEEAFAGKEVIINELKNSCNQLEAREATRKEETKLATEKLTKLENERAELEEELRTTKQITQEASREMSEYVSHLESVITNADQNLTEMKDKCNDAIKSLTTLRQEHDDLEKQISANVKAHEKTKDELDRCKEIIKNLEENYQKSEEAKCKALSDLTTIVKSEKEKTETLENLLTQRQSLEEEVSALRIKAEANTKAKDRLMKEQKNLMNEISTLKKDKLKMAHKYRHVKVECNERTKLLRRLDGKLKENLLEYNKRIACLETNVTNIIEKAVVYKDTFMEKRSEMNAMVRELQEQLQSVYTEKRGLETDAIKLQEAVKKFHRDLNVNRNESVSNSGLDNRRDRQDDTDLTEEPSDVSVANMKNGEMEKRLSIAEKELNELREKNRQLEEGKTDERSKYESIIAELKNQIRRYEVRLEVILKNISAFRKDPGRSAKGTEEIVILEERIKELTEELEKKRKQLLDMTEMLEKNDTAMKKKEEECTSLREKVLQLKEEIKSMKNQFSQLQEFLNVVNQNVETYQKERDEISGKLAKSLKLIVEERAAKQSSELIFAEKEKFLKDQLEQLQGILAEKKKEHEILLTMMDEKKGIITRLQDELKKWKSEVAILKAQVAGLKDQNPLRWETETGDDLGDGHLRQNPQLKEIRAKNLELRKSEGNLQTKIVCLEDDLRGARFLIKQLEGELKSEKSSKKILREMMTSAREDIEKFKRKGELLIPIADKLERHLDLSEAQSRELLSSYRS